MEAFLSAHINFSKEEYRAFKSLAKELYFKKNEQLLHANKPVEKIFFVVRGLIRGYRILDGVDITHHFFIENWFATDYESFLTQKTGELYMEALMDVTVYEFEKTSLYSFFKEHAEFAKIRAILAENAYLEMLGRLKDFQTKELKERYDTLIYKSPHLFKLVPQKYIASYLGVMPQSLSRIKTASKKN